MSSWSHRLLALTGYEIGLLTSALVFIVFALVVALVVPRSRPTFPSKHLGWFVAACIVLFVAQMTAVIVLSELGEEEQEEVAQESEPGETTLTETTPTETTSTTDTTGAETTGPTETTGTTEPNAGAGDPVAGKEVFLGAGGCGACHTLADAGTSGSIGPNLDAVSPSVETALDRVTNGAGVMPAFEDTLSGQQIQDVSAYVSSAAGG